MAKNWVGAEKKYEDPPRDSIVSASIHKKRNEMAVVEKFDNRFVLFVVNANNPDKVLHEIERNIQTKERAKQKLIDWLNNHSEGLKDIHT